MSGPHPSGPWMASQMFLPPERAWKTREPAHLNLPLTKPKWCLKSHCGALSPSVPELWHCVPFWNRGTNPVGKWCKITQINCCTRAVKTPTETPVALAGPNHTIFSLQTHVTLCLGLLPTQGCWLSSAVRLPSVTLISSVYWKWGNRKDSTIIFCLYGTSSY